MGGTCINCKHSKLARRTLWQWLKSFRAYQPCKIRCFNTKVWGKGRVFLPGNSELSCFERRTWNRQ